MSKVEQKQKELIGKYIIQQLQYKELSPSKREELNMFKDIYVNNKSKKEVVEKYGVARTTLHRSEKKFLEAYSKGEPYINVKSQKDKLTDEQNRKLEEDLKKVPLSLEMPYIAWNKDIIQDYIKSNFGIEYSKMSCYNIYNKNFKYMDDELIDYIKKHYKCWYNIDVFYVNEKSNKESFENKKKTLKKEKGTTYIGKPHKSKYVYAAMAVDDNSKVYKVAESLKDPSIDNSTKQKLIDFLLEQLPNDDKILLIFMNKCLSLNEALKLKQKHQNIDFIITDDKDDISRVFNNDFNDIRKNIEKQIGGKVALHSNHNKLIGWKIKNS